MPASNYKDEEEFLNSDRRHVNNRHRELSCEQLGIEAPPPALHTLHPVPPAPRLLPHQPLPLPALPPLRPPPLHPVQRSRSAHGEEVAQYPATLQETKAQSKQASMVGEYPQTAKNTLGNPEYQHRIISADNTAKDPKHLKDKPHVFNTLGPAPASAREKRVAVSTDHHCHKTLLYMIVLLFALSLTILIFKHTVTGMSADALSVLNATVSSGFYYVGARMKSLLRAVAPGSDKPGPESLTFEISPLIPHMVTLLAAIEKGTYDMGHVMELIPYDEMFEYGLPFSDGPASVLEKTNAWFDASMSSHLHRERQAMRQLLAGVEARPATRFLPPDPDARWSALGLPNLLVRLFTDQPQREMLARFDGVIHVLEDAEKARSRWIKRLRKKGEFMDAVNELKETSCHSASGLGKSRAELMGTASRGWLTSSRDSRELVALMHALEATQPHMDVLCMMIHEGEKSISHVRVLLKHDVIMISKAMKRLTGQRRELAELKSGQFSREVVMEAEGGMLKGIVEDWVKGTSNYMLKK
ncbi:hypothetical protein EDB80DRAFT_770952 [Ilyonectria destructans]|nr:hypothetical protein EDB80DRAFT_770952 [Ilyonectria destructans]